MRFSDRIAWHRSIVIALAVFGCTLPASAPGVAQSRPIVITVVGPNTALRAPGRGGVQVSSLAKALERVAAIRARDTARPIDVRLAPGRHAVVQPLKLDTRHARLTWGRLTISGTRDGRSTVTGLQPLRLQSVRTLPAAARSVLRAVLPRESLPRLRVAVLPQALRPQSPMAQHRFHPIAAAPVGLLLADASGPLRPARWPNVGWASAGPATSGRTVELPGMPSLGPVRAQSNAGVQAWVAGYFKYDWSFETYPVSPFNGPAVGLSRAARYGLGPGARVRVEHHPALLDQPGEWVYLAGRSLLAVL
ncbi:MAG: hypothetical protein AAFO79_04030, partial [Pseudomonadota bacterium]